MTRHRLLLLLSLTLLAGPGCCLLDCLQSWRKPHADPERAGQPEEIAPCAIASDTGSYVGYQVGGGAACGGNSPCVEDGTWGWDYQGWCLPSKVNLGWWHGQRDQGGPGDYRTDGPRIAEAIREHRGE